MKKGDLVSLIRKGMNKRVKKKKSILSTMSTTWAKGPSDYKEMYISAPS